MSDHDINRDFLLDLYFCVIRSHLPHQSAALICNYAAVISLGVGIYELMIHGPWSHR